MDLRLLSSTDSELWLSILILKSKFWPYLRTLLWPLCNKGLRTDVTFFILFNPLLRELFFSSALERQPKICSYRLPIQRRGAHRKFFLIIPSYFKIEILAICVLLWQLCNKGLKSCQKVSSLLYWFMRLYIGMQKIAKYTQKHVLYWFPFKPPASMHALARQLKLWFFLIVKIRSVAIYSHEQNNSWSTGYLTI